METPRNGSPAVAIITAAGSSTRMGNGLKKEYRIVAGMPVLAHAVSAFLLTDRFLRIIVTVPEADLASAPGLLSQYLDLGKVSFVQGGASRQESVRNGLLAPAAAETVSGEGLVLIHDGARPWVTPDLILRVLEAARLHGAALPVLPAVYAMKTVDSSGFIERHLDRSNLVSAQTPQGFAYAGILEAHRRALADGYTGYDDTELYGRYTGPVFTVPGDPGNVKITYEQDLEGAR